MIIRETPRNKEKFICVAEDDINYGLQRLEIYPVYLDREGLWYEKSEEIVRLLSKPLLLCKQI